MERRVIYMLIASFAMLALVVIGCGKDGDGPTDPPPPEKPIPVSISFLDEGSHTYSYYRRDNNIVIVERDSMYFRCFSYDSKGELTSDTVFSVLTSANAPCTIYTRFDQWGRNPYKVLAAGSLPSAAHTASTAILSEVRTPNKQPLSHTLNVTVAKRYFASSEERWGLYYSPYTSLPVYVYCTQFGDSIFSSQGIHGWGQIQQGEFRFDFSFPYPNYPPGPTSSKRLFVKFTDMNHANGFIYKFNGDSVGVKLIRG